MEVLENVTAVVLCCQRPANVPLIACELAKQGIQEIICWDNSPASLTCSDISDVCPQVVVRNCGRNVFTLGRFVAFAQARRRVVYTQDDDAMPGDVAALLRGLDDTGRLTTYLDPSHMLWSKAHYKLEDCPVDSWETLLGWGAVFPREWVSVLLSYIAFYGEADHTFMRKADRIFAMLLCQPHNEIQRDVWHLPGARGQDALYKQPDHNVLTNLAREKCRTLLRRQGGRPIAG